MIFTKSIKFDNTIIKLIRTPYDKSIEETLTKNLKELRSIYKQIINEEQNRLLEI